MVKPLEELSPVHSFDEGSDTNLLEPLGDSGRGGGQLVLSIAMAV